MISLLDHGHVRLVEHWGSDERIIEAARQSTQKGFKGWGPTCAECGFTYGDDHEVGCSEPEKTKPGDERLLKYLWQHKHMTPFEMAGMTIEVQAPICVFREWHRHRTQSYSEASARYAPLPALDYLPTVERCMLAAGANKQAGAAAFAGNLNEYSAANWLEQLTSLYEHAQSVYSLGLHIGIPKELARLALTVGRYSRMYASANLRNWTHFLSLRLDENAQQEIRVYAQAVESLIAEAFPRTHALFTHG